jgi:osmotically-inducible protein OsmY
MKTDKELQRDVLDELEWEPSVESAHIGVTAREGVVTLTGSVPSYSEKVTAERVVQRVHGVKGVANDIDVRPHGIGQRTDADIAEAAITALKWKASVPADRIKISVSKGWITLEGDVEWHYQSEAASEAVHHLLGVRGVINSIAVKPQVSAPDIRSRIEAAFRRNADLDAHKVAVEVHNGTVSLRGAVRSWAERQTAERAAWSAPGVFRVEDYIAVTPGGD